MSTAEQADMMNNHEFLLLLFKIKKCFGGKEEKVGLSNRSSASIMQLHPSSLCFFSSIALLSLRSDLNTRKGY